jgi:hypothetical protein
MTSYSRSPEKTKFLCVLNRFEQQIPLCLFSGQWGHFPEKIRTKIENLKRLISQMAGRSPFIAMICSRIFH